MALMTRTPTSLSNWNPALEMDRISGMMTRIFDDWQTNLAERGTSLGEVFTMADWSPVVDIKETPNSYIIDAELPGVKRKDFKVSLENDVLRIQGERRSLIEEKDEKHHRIERSYGRFYRAFSLPEHAEASKIDAKFEDGVLHVIVPRTEKPRAQAIDVKVK